MMDPKDVSEEQHEEFYRYVAQAPDKPRYTLHYKTDAPLNIRSIFYVPEMVSGHGLRAGGQGFSAVHPWICAAAALPSAVTAQHRHPRNYLSSIRMKENSLCPDRQTNLKVKERPGRPGLRDAAQAQGTAGRALEQPEVSWLQAAAVRSSAGP